METDKQLLFFFSLLGAFNGVLLAVYFIFLSKTKKTYNIFLGLLLLVVSIRIGKSVFFYFNSNLSSLYIHIGIMACALIGPLLYLFVRSGLVNNRAVKKYDVLHLLPLVIVVIIAIQFPYWDNRNLWRNLINLIYWQWFVYVIVTAFNLIPVFKSINSKSKTERDISAIWLLSVFIGVTIIWLAYKTSRYTSYIVGAVSFSFVFYIYILLIFKFSRHKKEESNVKKRTKQLLDEATINGIDNKLKQVVIAEKLYKNSILKVAQLLSLYIH